MDSRDLDRQIAPATIDGEEVVRRYDELKLEIARVGQRAMQLCRELGDQERVNQHQAVLARLAEDRFNLAILGQFSRGKSTLMNALMGMERLPTGVLPHTSVITTVSYGEKERILIRIQGWPLPQEIRFDQLADYVTESGNPGNRRRVVSAEIQLPVEMLRYGLTFIDTPGVGSTVAENTATTMRYLPEIDAAIFVTGFDSPFGDAELEFLRDALRTIGKIFVVVNKLDLVSPEDRTKVLQYIGARLADITDERLEVFAISARDALRGKRAGDQSGLDASGLRPLEQAVFCFLESGKIPQLCKRTLERLRGLLEIQGSELAASTASDPSAALARLDRHVGRFQHRRKELSTKALVDLRQNFGSCLTPFVDEVFAGLQSSIVARFEQKLVHGNNLIMGLRFREAMDRASSYFASRLTARLADSASELEQAIRAATGTTLREVGEIPAVAWADIVQAGSPEPLKTQEALRATVNVPLVEKVKWSGRVPWTVYLVPIQWAASAIRGWFEEATEQLLVEYRERLSKVLLEAAEDFLGEVDRDVEAQIKECAVRMTRTINSGPSLAGLEKRLKDLLLQLSKVQQLLVNSDAPRDVGAEPTLVESGSTPENRRAKRESAWEICPICARVTREVFEYLAQRQYDLGADGESQAQHARSGGFCSFHTWVYASLASPQSICHAYPQLLAARAEQLKRAAVRSVSTSELLRAASEAAQNPSRCPVCEIVRKKEEESARDVLAHISGSGDSPALCLPHLEVALGQGPDLETARSLVTATTGALEVMADAMTRFAIKFDAVRRGLITSTERNAYAAALSKLVGVRRLAANSIADDLR